MLDFDAALAQGAEPPLPHADGSVDEIRASEAFTRIDDGWAEWLLELSRLLADDGMLRIGLAAPAAFERLSGEPWDESRIGMTVLSALNGATGSVVFHSEWWLRAHWGRAFEIVSIGEREGRRRAHLRRSTAAVSPADLEHSDPGDNRELVAAQANAVYLRKQLAYAESRHRGELDEQREELHRELMRRAFAAADLDWSARGVGSPAMLVAAQYESTTSWKITRPLRALGRVLRRSS